MKMQTNKSPFQVSNRNLWDEIREFHLANKNMYFQNTCMTQVGDYFQNHIIHFTFFTLQSAAIPILVEMKESIWTSVNLLYFLSYWHFQWIFFTKMKTRFEWENSRGIYILVCYPAAKSQSMIKDDTAIGIQLKKANTIEIWYLRHSSPKWQCPRSLKYNTVMPAEDDAAARDSVAVTCEQWSRRIVNEKSYLCNKQIVRVKVLVERANPISNQIEANKYRVVEDLLSQQGICIQWSEHGTPNDL